MRDTKDASRHCLYIRGSEFTDLIRRIKNDELAIDKLPPAPIREIMKHF